ncbi:MAG: ATP-dependent Clp protease proteolytic subunit, partial [Planctomycetaceae bacterium]|nr:ATP-dependent Clp protease proteolytic subunit [Planctomycetaceae bacterium]
DRDFYLNAEEAKAYGVVDDVLKKNSIEQEESA